MTPLPLEIAPAEVKARLDRGERMRLIDVREPHELQRAAIAGGEPIPMREVAAALDRLDTDEPLVVICHHGMRSLQVTHWLRGQGVGNCQSMAGGIDQWSVEIDPKVPRY